MMISRINGYITTPLYSRTNQIFGRRKRSDSYEKLLSYINALEDEKANLQSQIKNLRDELKNYRELSPEYNRIAKNIIEKEKKEKELDIKLRSQYKLKIKMEEE